MKNKIEIAASVFVNLNACDGCGVCATACPTGVFSMKGLNDDEINELSFLGRLKVRIKGNKKSDVEKPDACIACGKCVSSCHEHAITVKGLKRSA